MAQRAVAVTELRGLTGLDQGEAAAAQCRRSRIKNDQKQMNAIQEKMDEMCDPFSDAVSSSLVNIATGRATTSATESYLLNTLNRGKMAREQFQFEWDNDCDRFLKPVKRIRVENFAAENEKKRPKTPASEMRTKMP